jgi:FtsP/CotA-like multicopper oxidase with cupredoxin domain
VKRRTLLLGGLAATVLGAAAPPEPTRELGRELSRQSGTVIETSLDIHLETRTSEVDLAGKIVQAWTYDGRVPGTPLRASAGDQLQVTLANRLPAETTIHWHGIAVGNRADGVPHLTQEPIAVGADYTYRFTTVHPGTYWFHPHTGTQLDRGLYTPLIVEDPREPLSYDTEWVVVLDDWLDSDPDEVIGGLRGQSGHGRDMSAMGGRTAVSALLGGQAGNVEYPYFLLNGRPTADPEVFRAKPRQRVRVRFLNAAADTVFRVAIGGHRMSVTHTDGYPVVPTETDALLIGMGERYDALITLRPGVFPVVALAEGKGDKAFGLIRTAGGQAPSASVMPAELDRRIIGYRELEPAESVVLPSKRTQRRIRLALTGSMVGYTWGFNGKQFDHANPTKDTYEVATGERVRLDLVNTTTMFHPVHVHGHTFALGAATGPRKDTAIVLPGQSMPFYFDADNPGQWMIHCHNVYHAEAGMMTVLAYRPEA